MRNISDIRAAVVRVAGVSLLVSVIALLLWTSAYAQTLTWLGALPGGGWSQARGVSADGRVVVGAAIGDTGIGLGYRAFRWTPATGMVDLGTLPGRNESGALGVSADGRVVVGWSRNNTGDDPSDPDRPAHAFRWTQATGMVDLGTLGGSESYACGASADGSVVVGSARNTSGYPGDWRAFRWTQATGMVDLGTLGGIGSAAYGVSLDGSVVVGEAANASGVGVAFRWENGVMQGLGTLPSGNYSAATGVSLDGRVVVGRARNASGAMRAFRWTQATGMVDLGTLPGRGHSTASGVSADGRVIVGWSENTSSDRRAFRWTASGGMEDLNSTYAHLLPNGSYLSAAFAVSPDGRYIVGEGYNAQARSREAWLLDTWCNPADLNNDGVIDDADLLAILMSFGTPGTGYTRHEDINKDGVVDDADLLTVLSNFGSVC